MKTILSQHDVVYDKAPVRWQDGLIMGNGSLGAVYYAPEALEFLINKTDVLDARTKKVKRVIPPPEAEEMIQKGASAHDFLNEEIIKNDVEGSGPKNCCMLRMDMGMTAGVGTRSALPENSSRLSLTDATVTIALDKHLCHPRLTSFIDANSNTFVFKAKDISPFVSFNNRIFFSRPDDIEIGEPELWTENGRLYMRMSIPESGYYVVGMQVIPRTSTALRELYTKSVREKHRQPETGTVNLAVRGKHGTINVQGDFELFLTVVTSHESENPLKQVNDNLDAALERGMADIYSAHAQWWNAYWNKSKAELGDKRLNDLFYRSLYALGCSYQKAPMSGLVGLFYGPTPGPIQYSPWNGDLHHDLNIQCPFFPVFALNHDELFDAYRETYHNFLPEAKRLAKEIFYANGAHFDMAFNALGRSMFQGVGKYRYAFMGSYVALIHCIAWKYKQDVEELRERIYPFLKEVIAFYRSMMKDKHLWPAHAAELDVMDCANPVQTISMLKICLKTAIEAADLLNTDVELKKQWCDMLNKLPEYPTGIDCKGRKIVLDGEGIHPDHHVGQAGCIHPVYPCGEVDEFSNLEELELYKHTLQSVVEKTAQTSYAADSTFYFQCVWQCFFRAMTALRLGMHDEFWNFYMPMFMDTYVKPNGLCSHDACCIVDPAVSEKNLENIPGESLLDVDDWMPKSEPWSNGGMSTPNLEAKKYTVPLIEASADFLTMITETLLQSHNGIIRIFPAWPKDKDASFENFVAEGDIKVSAKMENGEVNFIKLVKGKNCRLNSVKIKLPWTDGIKKYDFPENGIIRINHQKERKCTCKNSREALPV